ncbi:Hexokinase-3 [Manis pentadactyla]|nr:Hexokinase-3 [Manis pentadactyla]
MVDSPSVSLCCPKEFLSLLLKQIFHNGFSLVFLVHILILDKSSVMKHSKGKDYEAETSALYFPDSWSLTSPRVMSERFLIFFF